MRYLRAAGLSSVVVTGCVCFGGPITPPAGPVSSTNKTLTEVEPRIAVNATNTPGDGDSVFKITQPGSYYLLGNLTGSSAKHGIEIAASGVTLDLNGFELRGVSGSLDGINVSAFRGRNIVVKNGSLRSWGDCGIEGEYNAGNPPACNVIAVSASLNARDGFSLQGDGSYVNCTAFENGADGFGESGGNQYENCVAWANGDDGFAVNSGSTLLNCVSRANTNRGFYGGTGSAFTNCSATQNAIGFVSSGSSFTGCGADFNDGAGFDVFAGCVLTACSSYGNGTNGFESSSSATIIGCNAYSNTEAGISIVSGTVLGCTVNSNDVVGVLVSANSQVRDNTIINNGGSTASNANLRVTSSDNRIEGNNCTDAPIGIEVQASGNIIVRNTCSGNTVNWDIVANNIVGPIVAGTLSAAISGDTGGSGVGSTNPWANITF